MVKKQGLNIIKIIKFYLKMNSIDKQWLKTLRYFADSTRAQISARKEQFPDEYKEYVPKDLEDTFVNFGYLDLNGNTKYIITQNGLQQLRDLEQIRNKDWIRYATIGSWIVSIVALLKSFGVI